MPGLDRRNVGQQSLPGLIRGQGLEPGRFKDLVQGSLTQEMDFSDFNRSSVGSFGASPNFPDNPFRLPSPNTENAFSRETGFGGDLFLSGGTNSQGEPNVQSQQFVDSQREGLLAEFRGKQRIGLLKEQDPRLLPQFSGSGAITEQQGSDAFNSSLMDLIGGLLQSLLTSGQLFAGGQQQQQPAAFRTDLNRLGANRLF